MLPQLINLILSQNIAPDIRNNIIQVQQVASKFDAAYENFGKALTKEQQVFISGNLDKLEAYFESESGKDAISLLVDEFEKFTKA